MSAENPAFSKIFENNPSNFGPGGGAPMPGGWANAVESARMPVANARKTGRIFMGFGFDYRAAALFQTTSIARKYQPQDKRLSLVFLFGRLMACADFFGG
jgi:hypothetical protein